MNRGRGRRERASAILPSLAAAMQRLIFPMQALTFLMTLMGMTSLREEKEGRGGGSCGGSNQAERGGRGRSA